MDYRLFFPLTFGSKLDVVELDAGTGRSVSASPCVPAVYRRNLHAWQMSSPFTAASLQCRVPSVLGTTIRHGSRVVLGSTKAASLKSRLGDVIQYSLEIVQENGVGCTLENECELARLVSRDTGTRTAQNLPSKMDFCLPVW